MGACLSGAGADTVPVFCSPQARAETSLIASEEGRATVDPRLREIGLGPFSGRYLVGLAAEYPELFRGSHPGDWHFRPPGGATFDAMRSRVAAFLGDLAGPSIIVRHGMTSRFPWGVALGLDRDGMLEPPGGQGVFHVVENGRHRTI